tara:strand:+ start:767 stop:1096 length:330 start_codon:yes stop_codon:yes gene_type:complete
MERSVIWLAMVASYFLCVTFIGCASMKYANIEKQKKVHQQLTKKMEYSNTRRAYRQKKLFDAMKEKDEYEEVSYTKEKIDKYFERIHERRNLDELDEVYEEIEKTKKPK